MLTKTNEKVCFFHLNCLATIEGHFYSRFLRC